MSNKKLYTREEFEELRINSAKQMHIDEKLQADTLKVLVKADQHH